MLKKLLPLFFILAATTLPLNTQAQGLSLNQMVSMYEGDYDEVNSTLLPQGWLFKGTDVSMDSVTCGEKTQATWAYRLDGETEKAKSFVNYVKSEYCVPMVAYQTLDINVYNRIRASITKIGMRRVNSNSGSLEETDGAESYISSEFEGARYRIVLSVISYRDDEGDANNYYLIVLRQKPSAEE